MAGGVSGARSVFARPAQRTTESPAAGGPIFNPARDERPLPRRSVYGAHSLLGTGRPPDGPGFAQHVGQRIERWHEAFRSYLGAHSADDGFLGLRGVPAGGRQRAAALSTDARTLGERPPGAASGGSHPASVDAGFRTDVDRGRLTVGHGSGAQPWGRSQPVSG